MKSFRGIQLPAGTPHQVSASIFPNALTRCRACGAPLAGTPRYDRFRVCGECGQAYPISGRDRIASLVDEKSFTEIAAFMASGDPIAFEDDEPYADRLNEQRKRTGEFDAAIAGTATLRGRRIVLSVLDFSFMGGSMGVVVGEKVALAAELALKTRTPLVSVVASGGARMQEGLYSLLQMAKTSAAVQRLHRDGIPYISVLTDPTTGGVFASFASLGDVIVAEPGALIGFAGPRVVEQMLGESLPPGTHTSEFLFEHGIIDEIVDRVHLRGYLADLLSILMPLDKKAEPLISPGAMRASEQEEPSARRMVVRPNRTWERPANFA